MSRYFFASGKIISQMTYRYSHGNNVKYTQKELTPKLPKFMFKTQFFLEVINELN